MRVSRHLGPGAISSRATGPCSHSHGSCSVSSWHCHILLSGTAHSPAAASTATGATGHDKGVALQVAAEPGLNDLAQVAGDERDHPDAISGNRLMVRPGDRAANQRSDAKLHQAKRLLGRLLLTRPERVIWRKVAVALLKARNGGAEVLLFPRPTGAAVLLGKGDSQFFHFAEKSGWGCGSHPRR